MRICVAVQLLHFQDVIHCSQVHARVGSYPRSHSVYRFYVSTRVTQVADFQGTNGEFYVY